MLVADIGNTDIVFGIFQGSTLAHTFRIPSKKEESALFFEYQLHNFFLEQNISAGGFEKVVLSSVVPQLTDLIAGVLCRVSGKEPIIVKPNCHAKVTVLIDDPEQLGSDLYTNSVYAYVKTQKACIIVDFGTALTFTAVNDTGSVIGVAICPGLKTAVNSLFSKTAQLPEVPLVLPNKAIGRNTIDSIQSGVLIGYEGLVKNLLNHFKKEIGTTVRVFATGGLSSILTGLKSEFDVVDINLTLKGLRIIGLAAK